MEARTVPVRMERVAGPLSRLNLEIPQTRRLIFQLTKASNTEREQIAQNVSVASGLGRSKPSSKMTCNKPNCWLDNAQPADI